MARSPLGWSRENNPRLYEALDTNDSFSCKPDFVAMIYPGGLTAGNSFNIKEPIASKIDRDSPPMFFVHASDDQAENSLAYALALKQARVPVEVHIYRDGAHGFGMRQSGVPVGNWTDRFEDWMRSLGFLDKAFVRNLCRTVREGLKSDGATAAIPRGGHFGRRVLRSKAFAAGTQGQHRRGYKGGVVTDKAQKSLGPGPAVDRRVADIRTVERGQQAGDPTRFRTGHDGRNRDRLHHR